MEKRIKQRLYWSCLNKEDHGCYIKTGCVENANSNYFKLEYLADTETFGEADRLQSISEFIENGGGDCEDYALFYKAEVNYMLGECEEFSPDEITFESYYTGRGANSRYWLDYDEYWYIEPVNLFLFDTTIYPSVVCGQIYDFNTKKVSGHCIVAFTDQKIESIEDIETELDGAILIEPQTGEFLGYLNGASYGRNYPLGIEDLWVLITDNDYYIYKSGVGWAGYSLFAEKLAEEKAKLENLN